MTATAPHRTPPNAACAFGPARLGDHPASFALPTWRDEASHDPAVGAHFRR